MNCRYPRGDCEFQKIMKSPYYEQGLYKICISPQLPLTCPDETIRIHLLHKNEDVKE